jgi:Mor family transcriptional regulator
VNFSELCEILGEEAAEALVAECGGEDIRIPARSSMRSYKRRRAVARDFERGAGYREVAARHGLTLSWSHRLWKQFMDGGL